ncbi:LCP family protein [Streptomyces xiaopingdaonensis]|uniref:LCP family protein n=1 Tax=Streptomyces xiaopingdaonensis TaxID=1565415 RepID=UPI00031540F8|nr:LCP family protein [Streptomyces xiaopingdaonensis]
MSDGYGYDPYGRQPEILGYDEYGRPIYASAPQSQQTYQGYDPSAQHPGYPSYDSYADPYAQQPQGHGRPYAGEQAGYDPYAYSPDSPQQQPDPYAPQQPPLPHQAQPPQEGPAADAGPDYRTEQFSFVEEPAEESEDVIDWLKFSESRTERREEAKRRGRNRIVALVVAAVVLVAGGLGYLWYAGMLPGLDGSKEEAAATGEQRRDVIVVHLRSTDGGDTSTALLVDNESAGKGRTLLLPNSLAVTAEEGTTTTLGKAVEGEGASPTRDALGTLLGADIKGTWRLDTPYLENLVELVGGITIDADATIPAKKKGESPLVRSGADRDLDGRAAVAYATHRAPAEAEAKQLNRFGQVLHASLRKLSSEPAAAGRTVESLGQIPDPSLSEKQLGASLAKLAEQAKNGSYDTRVLPVRANGTLSQATSEGMVKQILGGTVKNSDTDGVLRVGVENATGARGRDDAASVALVNSGYTVVKGGAAASARARSAVTYVDAGDKAKAVEVAKTLGLRESAARKGEVSGNADVSVVLGADYKG